MNKEYERIRKEIVEEVCCVCVHKPTSVEDGLFPDSPKTLNGLGCTFGYEQGSNKYCQLVVKVANQLLSIKGVAILSDDQCLPDPFVNKYPSPPELRDMAIKWYHKGIAKLLKAGFVKVVKEEK